MPKPIKRHQSLQPISREHHHGLLLSWKIREGFKLKISPARIKKYVDWFWKNYLQTHFEFEERFIFSILDEENALIKRALQEHQRLKALFSTQEDIELTLSLIEKELVDHIRFEERVLFKEVERIATTAQLETIEKAHSKNRVDDWSDEFWIEKKA